MRRNTLGNQEGPLETGLRSIWGPPLPFTNIVYRALNQCGQPFPCRQGSAGNYQDHQGGNVHKSQWPIPQQEQRKVPAVQHLGWDPTGLPFPQSQETFCHHSVMGTPSSWHTLETHILHFGKYGPSNPPWVPNYSLLAPVPQTHTGAICVKYTLVSITFPIHLLKPCQVGLGKACLLIIW